MALVAGIDSSTQSCKVIVVDGFRPDEIEAFGAHGVVTFNRPTVKESAKMPDLKARAETSST